MSADKFDKELSELYQQRKQQTIVPELELSTAANKQQSNQRSPFHMLALLLAGGIASFGIMAMVNYFAKPDVHGSLDQYKKHSVKIIELAPDKIEPNVLPPTPPLPPKPEHTAPASTSTLEHTADIIAVEKPNIALEHSINDAINVPNIAQPTSQPAPIHKVMPEYPKSAVFARQSGTVKLAYRINEQGQVVDIISFNERSHRALEKSAKQALAKWQFSPQAHSDKTLEVMFEFNLDN